MPISIGERTNIQDGTIIHGTYQIAETKIGNNVTIGHKCVLHGCEIEDLCLIGMGSIIMDNVTVKKGSFVAAGSLLPPGKVYESGMMIMGSPAKVVRPLNEKEKQFLQQSANNYLKYLEWYQV
jgi:carbonic anhydrase/acetyltransferase-like protein (isoleucine patch superfamily)